MSQFFKTDKRGDMVYELKMTDKNRTIIYHSCHSKEAAFKEYYDRVEKAKHLEEKYKDMNEELTISIIIPIDVFFNRYHNVISQTFNISAECFVNNKPIIQY